MARRALHTTRGRLVYAARLVGALNVGALGTAIADVLGRHDILRTSFHKAGSRVIARVSSI